MDKIIRLDFTEQESEALINVYVNKCDKLGISLVDKDQDNILVKAIEQLKDKRKIEANSYYLGILRWYLCDSDVSLLDKRKWDTLHRCLAKFKKEISS